MKKRLGLLALLLSFAFTDLTLNAFAAPRSYPILERFDDTPAQKLPVGWTHENSGGIVQIESAPSATNHSLAFKRTSIGGAVWATKAINPLKGRVTIECRAMSNDSRGVKIALTSSDSKRFPMMAISFYDGDLIYTNAGSKKIIQAFKPGEWYLLRAEINTVSGTYSVYVDGIKKAENAKLAVPGINVAEFSCGIPTGSDNSLYVDNVWVYDYASQIGTPPKPVFDITKYGAIADGQTDNTVAIQKAINACAGSRGSVLVPSGTFRSGSLTLKSDMTLFVAADATLKGMEDNASYPPHEIPNFPNKAIEGLRKSFLFALGARNLKIDGGGTIDGSGTIPLWRDNGNEAKRPFLFLPVLCQNLTVQNVYFKDAGMWCFVPSECTNVNIRNLGIDSRSYGNRDGIDVVDSKNVIIENCTINTDDDSICPKSGALRGVENLTVRNCNLMGSMRASGIKFGTVSYGALKNATFENILIKNCDKAAMGLEAVDGAAISNVTFRKIEIFNTNSPVYMVIGTRGRTPAGSPKRTGSISEVLFEDITARNLKYNLGCPISGNIIDGRRVPITNLTFRHCDMSFKGGLTTIPKTPPEMGGQYPECNIWGPMPAYGYFIRHADNVSFIDCKTGVAEMDARKGFEMVDVARYVMH